MLLLEIWAKTRQKQLHGKRTAIFVKKN